MAGTITYPFKGAGGTIFVAASNASAQSLRRADFICTGSGDQATIASARAALPAGGGSIQFSEGTFLLSAPIVLSGVSNIVFQGQGSATIFQSNSGTNNDIFTYGTQPFSDIVWDGLTFIGPVNQFPTVPTNARTTSGVGMTRAIDLQGSLDPTGSFPVISNITIRNCIVRNSFDLPLRLSGISGKMSVTNCEFTNNRDVGFLFCQEAIFSNNHVQQTRDNGVSFSRQCQKAVCTGNTFENICYAGIDVSGFLTQEGGWNFSVTGNTIKNVGQAGILIQDAPKYGAVSGNEIDCGLFRGPVDGANDTTCAGIVVRGYPSGSVPSYTDFTTGVEISNNHIRGGARAGILLDGAIAVTLENNLIQDCGTQFKADGTTVIAATDTTQNIGILFDFPTTITDIKCSNNIIVDERGTPFCNWGIYPNPCINVTQYDNVMGTTLRNANNLPPVGINGVFGGGSDGAVVLDGTATFNAFSSKVGSVYTLTRDVYATNFTINSGVSVGRSGFVINCSGTYTNNGTDSAKGADASGATGGVGTSAGTQRGGTTGGTGTTGAGAGSTAVSNALGGTGGTGGNSGGTNGAAAGTATAPTAANGSAGLASRLPYCAVGASFTPVQAAVQGWAGGTGGGSGGGDGTNAGGGGGGGGGVFLLNARYVIVASGAIIRASGGAGGAGVAGNAAGGGGGGGGLLIINTTSYTGTTPTAAANCPGGAVGTSQGTGTAASVGSTGSVFVNIFS